MDRTRIRDIRIGMALSQERFARLLGVSLQSVRRWESGLSRPLPLIMARLEELQRQMPGSETGKEGATMRDKPRNSPGGIDIDVGLGGLFKGIGGLLDFVSAMAEEGKTEGSRTVEKDIMGGKGKAVYGFSVRVGLGGKPVIESFGNVRSTPSGTVVAEVREPLVDIFDEGNEIHVIAEIPGVEEKSIELSAKDDILTIAAEARERKYRKEVLLPAAVKPEIKSQSYLNGVLELRLQKR
ncbi:MAG: helix-turn-helix domain-containing protein [Chloroflexi bacterium]|nr:helix-turn-helix domain-containing protein [Chloroflexota bacterium]